MRVVLCGGGTGGHVFPALAIGEALRDARADVDLHYVGTASGIESRLVPAAGENLHVISAGGLVGKSPLKRVASLAHAAAGVLQTIGLLRSLKPKIVVGTGGYATAPVLLAARMLRIPFVLQEQNSYPGLTTRKFAPHARAVFIAYPGAEQFLASAKCISTGNPLRRKILDNAAGVVHSAANTTILVTGGSLGARSINRAVGEVLIKLTSLAAVEWQFGRTGLPDNLRTSEFQGLTANAKVLSAPFFDDMPAHYSRASVVICRAGAMTLSEIALYGLPAVLIPFPHAAHDHQRANARAVVSAGAALLIEDDQLTGERLLKSVSTILHDDTTHNRMSEAMRSLARPHAATEIAQHILRLA